MPPPAQGLTLSSHSIDILASVVSLHIIVLGWRDSVTRNPALTTCWWFPTLTASYQAHNVHQHPPKSRQISCISLRPSTYSIRLVSFFSNGKAPWRLVIGDTRSFDMPLYDLQLWRPILTSCTDRTCGGLLDKTLFLSQRTR